jgi:hypothetical protein
MFDQVIALLKISRMPGDLFGYKGLTQRAILITFILGLFDLAHLARNSAAVPVIAAAKCGTMPNVQPAAATRLARAPRESPAVIVNSAPVPGVATITSDVSRKARLTTTSSTADPARYSPAFTVRPGNRWGRRPLRRGCKGPRGRRRRRFGMRDA